MEKVLKVMKIKIDHCISQFGFNNHFFSNKEEIYV